MIEIQNHRRFPKKFKSEDLKSVKWDKHTHTQNVKRWRQNEDPPSFGQQTNFNYKLLWYVLFNNEIYWDSFPRHLKPNVIKRI